MNAGEEALLSGFKAHKATILAEIQTESNNLNSILTKKAEANKEYASVLDKIASAQKELGAILASGQEEAKRVDAKRQKLDSDRAEFAKEKAEFELYKKNETSALDQKRSDTEDYILGKQLEIKDLEAEELAKRASYNEISSDHQKLKQEYDGATSEYREWSIGAEHDRKEHERVLNEMRSEKSELESQLASIKEQLANEAKKIGSAEKKIAEDLQDLARLKKNIDVYARRVRIAYEKLYPGRKFKLT